MKRKKRGLFAILALVILLAGMLRGETVMTARAEAAVMAELESAFSIQAELLPSDKETYSVRLTVENQGPDWEGTVRLIANEDYRIPCAYDTELSLPQGSRKQFVVKVPLDSIDNTNGTVNVILLDRKGTVEARQEFNRLLLGQVEALSLGILSDAYSKLTYMDLGGEEIFFYNDYYPIKLVQLQQGSLEEELESLTFLVIDQYNTGILTQEELEAIEQWNRGGGVLILGTGAYAEDTLRGFAGGYLGLSCREIHAPEEGYALYSGAGSFADLSQLTLAELEGTADKINSFYTSWFDSVGNGSLCVTAYSLTELADLEETYWVLDRKDFVTQLLDNTSVYASMRYSAYSSYYDNSSYYIRRLLGIVGNSNSILNFGVLKWIVILYVIFVGPILYLILRLANRRELYWLAVPATALLGIGLVFLAGRGFEVVNTKVYSVTVKNLSGSGNGITYLYCYDADRREWSLRLAEGCEYAGPLNNTSYYGSSASDAYYYHIKKEGDTFFMGVKPDSNFEDSYFYLSSTGNDSGTEGSLLMQNMAANYWDGVSGTITNDTNKNIEYLAVLWNDSMYIFEGLPAGASCRLEEMPVLYDSSNFFYGSYIYDFMQDYYYDKDYGKVSTLAALGVGMYDAFYDALAQAGDNEFVVVGVVENWDKIVDDTCSEISYGCLYAVQ